MSVSREKVTKSRDVRVRWALVPSLVLAQPALQGWSTYVTASKFSIFICQWRQETHFVLEMTTLDDIEACLIFLCFTLLYFTDTAFITNWNLWQLCVKQVYWYVFFFFQQRVLTSYLCHILVIIVTFQTFHYSYLIWWSVITEIWCDYNYFGAAWTMLT